MRRLVSLASCFVGACVLSAQSPTVTDSVSVSFSGPAWRQIESMMRRGVRDQREPAACVASWHVTPNGHVAIDALTLAETDSSDVVTIWAHGGRICDDTVPVVHGHVWRGGIVDRPSAVDSTTLQRMHTPWSVVIYRAANDTTFGFTLYWRHP